MTDALPTVLVSRLLDDSLDAVIIIDQQCRIRYMNGAMQTLSGYAGGELLGQPLDGLLPDALSAHHGGYVQRYMRESRVSSVLAQVREFVIRHRNAEMIPIEMKAVDLGVVDGTHYFGAFMLDLRERRALEAKNSSLLAQLERQALCDALTGLPNRRAFEIEAIRATARAARHTGPVTVGVADVDHFKRINDQYGHAAGDSVLCAVARALRDAGRVSDVVARLGGEEFGMLFPDASIEQARQIAERVRRTVGAIRNPMPDGSTISVTISIGLAQLASEGTIDSAMLEADQALYRAKHGGRDRVETMLPPRAMSA